ncbi:APC membrane recruitment protein 3 [Anabarilius grahami]|uniref:APC membrane recruitment protein 3 n=1 Tax=Anabarilius grahami TaxID=495550 RepID=A0A3N0ZAY8_ANAGA|nr:APC membrane recruitment protein 3 [Anabarilius grahami]
MELSKSEDSSDDSKKSSKAHGRSKWHVEHKSHNTPNNGFVNTHSTDESPSSLLVPDTLDILSQAVSDTLSEGHERRRGSVKRSRTHDSVRGMGLQQAKSPAYKDATNWRHHHKLVTSVSFSGFEAPLRLLCENRDTSGSSHEIIDYRNLTPQVPFVPCIAKSIPKKRISLRKPRKAIKDLFVHKRHKHEKATSPSTPCHVAGENVPTLKRTRKTVRHREYTTARSRYNDDLSETPSDSSSECCASVCEDAASLKSFGSQAGCGEIFADDLVSPEGMFNPEHDKVTCEAQRPSPTTASFQGGKECLASPAHAEVLDMFGLWETLNRTLDLGNSSKVTEHATKSTTPIMKSPSTSNSEDVTANTHQSVEPEIRELNTDVVTPKSDNQGNTSDEGYCDYVSPGFEDRSRSSLTPVHSNKFPRDTYSGDALYELFCDPSEAEITPIFDDEIDLTDSIVDQCSDYPLSMYSFHVGAEENLAPPLARDFVGRELLESKWMGKDCLLKLCDTEISLAMGIVNWLKHRTDKSNPTEPRSLQSSGEETGDLCLSYKTQPARVRKPPRGARTVNNRGDTVHFKERSQQSVGVMPSKYDANTVMSTLASPESQPKTPTSGVCFRIFNVDSPMTPGGDLQSPVVSSPGSGTRSLFVLAINKESLCESCKSSLKNGAKDLHLCRSCMSLIEHIKTSDLWARASLPRFTLTPQPITRDLLSPASTCGIGSDISIASLVEQCASQLSSMKINFTQTRSSCEIRDVPVPEHGVKRNKGHSQKYLKSKHKKRPVATTERALHARHRLSRSSISEDVKPSLLETEGLGFVTTNASNDLVLETYGSCAVESGDTDVSQATRPTSLPLMTSATSEFPCGEDHHIHHLNMTEEGNPAKKKHGLRHRKKSAVKSEGSCSVFPGDRKVERRCRMKK